MGIGGAESHILSLSSALARLGNDVTVAAREGELCKRLSPSVKFIPIETGKTKGLFELRRLINAGAYDIVHAHSRWTAFAVNFARNSLFKAKFGFAVTAHALYRKDLTKDKFSVWGDATIAVSNDIAEMLAERYALSKQRITVIPNGIDTDIFTAARSKITGHKLLFASRLDDDCSLGAKLLCDIIPKLDRRTTLTIAGGGEGFPSIKKEAERINHKLGRTAIRAVGATTDLTPLIDECDLAVGVSRFALEAMAMKKNVILFGNEGALGLLCPQKWDTAAKSNFTARGCGIKGSSFLMREIKRFFDTDHDERRSYAEFCQKKVISEHSSDRMAKMTLKVYLGILPRTTVLLNGYYGFGNIGDETVRKILTDKLQSGLPRATVSVMTASPVKRDDVCRHSPSSVIAAIKKADVYVSGGGSLFQDATSLRSPVFYCALISLAKIMGCRIAVVANGIGPTRRSITKALVGSALSKCGYISLRDPISLEMGSELTSGRIRPRLSADPAFCAVLPTSPGGNALAVSFRSNERNCLCAVGMLSPFVLSVAMDKVRDGGIFPRDFSSGARLLRNCRGAVGSRLHFLIMALLCRVPFAPVGNDPKLVAFSQMTLGRDPIDPASFESPRKLADELERYLHSCENFYQSGRAERFIKRQRKLFEDDILALSEFCKDRSEDKLKKISESN